jgi:hypothetical protein
MTTTTLKPFAVLQINGKGIQQGTPGEVRVYSTHETFEDAESEMLRLSPTHDERIYEFNVGELKGDEYQQVQW